VTSRSERFEPPVFLWNGAWSEPKELKWYDTGHDIDDIAALADRAQFLARSLRLKNIEYLLREKMTLR